MRYSIMLQVVATITALFLSTAALFAWLQYRPVPEEQKNSWISLRLIAVKSQS